MKAADFLKARQTLGLSQSQMAKALAKKSGARLIRAYELGERKIPEDTAKLVRYLLIFGDIDL